MSMSEDVRPDGEVNNLEDMTASVKAARNLQMEHFHLLEWQEIRACAKLVLTYLSLAHLATAQKKCTLQFLDASVARLSAFCHAVELSAQLPDGATRDS